MYLFKKNIELKRKFEEQEKRQKEEEIEARIMRAKLERKIANLDRFPGSLAEYNAFKGLEYEIMDTGMPEKFVDERDLRKIVIQGCEALIHYNLNRAVDYNRPFGVPVKRK
jgi:hypothetical protein